jgi:hypothetical protein
MTKDEDQAYEQWRQARIDRAWGSNGERNVCNTTHDCSAAAFSFSRRRGSVPGFARICTAQRISRKPTGTRAPHPGMGSTEEW